MATEIGEDRKGSKAGSHLESPSSSRRALDVLVSVDWLASQLDSNAVTVLDVRTPEAYQSGHIPGARSLPLEQTYDTREGKEKNVASVRTINKIFGDVGVRIDEPVIVYGSQDYRRPARLFWVLEVHGHRSAAVLDGGVEAWEESGRRFSTESPTWEQTRFVASFDPDRHVDKLEMFHAMQDPNITVLDSRSRAEYVGTKSKGKRFGHVTTALHVDATGGLDTQEGVCRVRDRSVLERRFESIEREQTIYTYCNSGRHAAVNYLLLRSLGYRVAVYDGSWLEWSDDDNLPISSGDSPGELSY